MSTTTSSEIFEGIAAVAQLGAACAVAVGVGVAYGQLKATREAVSRRRRSELAEEMIVLARQVDDAFKYMRNPFDQVPHDKINDKEFMYKKRYERVSESRDLFQKLREYQIRCDAVIAGADLERHVSELFNARTDIAIAIEQLIDESSLDSSDRNIGRDRESTSILYGTWSDRDKFGQKIQSELRAIVATLKPYASSPEVKK